MTPVDTSTTGGNLTPSRDPKHQHLLRIVSDAFSNHGYVDSYAFHELIAASLKRIESDQGKVAQPAPKPLEFPAPPEGEAWEPLGDFTPEEYGIPDGWRPFLKEERIESGDQAIYRPLSIKFGLVSTVEFEDFTFGETIARGCFGRTKRDLPTPKKRVPLEANDIPAVCWVRNRQDCAAMVIGVSPTRITVTGGDIFMDPTNAPRMVGSKTFLELMLEGVEYSTDRVTWLPCSKIEEAE